MRDPLEVTCLASARVGYTHLLCPRGRVHAQHKTCINLCTKKPAPLLPAPLFGWATPRLEPACATLGGVCARPPCPRANWPVRDRAGAPPECQGAV